MKKIAYYVSAHGFGHGVRTCDILSAWFARRPETQVVLTTDLPGSFLLPRLKGLPVVLRAGSFDVGMIQVDSVQVDVAATLRAVEAVFARRAELIEQEVRFLKASGVGLVVADIPSIPLEAAAAVGVPGVAIGNFAWNWIYSPFVERDKGWRAIIDQFEEGYRRAEVLLRLPFAEKMSVFRRQVDIPLLAQPGHSCRAELARATGADPDKTWVLLSFAGLDWTEEVVRRVAAEREFEFFTVKPLMWENSGIHALDREQVAFSDVLASADAVVSKPGFGLLSECIANNKPLVYVDRRDFIEYPILEEAIRRYIRGVHIPQEDLYAGRLASFLKQVPLLPAAPCLMEGGGGGKVVDEWSRFL